MYESVRYRAGRKTKRKIRRASDSRNGRRRKRWLYNEQLTTEVAQVLTTILKAVSSIFARRRKSIWQKKRQKNRTWEERTKNKVKETWKTGWQWVTVALWARIIWNKDWSTGPLTHPFARSLAPLLVHLLRTTCFARALCCAHSLARSLTSLTSLLVGQWLIRWLFILCFFLFMAIVEGDRETRLLLCISA